ncbi:ABC transporter ATP-binding protein [Halobacillus campisalis]|uniref:ABC transporter ATP-binding protein n=1 Tax=Halobacillus campisalis TaxID=435909 RepID=A0ABW2K0B2_9BACI|nr:sn-glycerol-3-phosphate ABC transporter ATP-binding protein UgpC [Halobacillus campisalis]
MAQLVLDRVEKIYDKKFKAVKDFNLHIGDEEFIVFVGPSGCGKSTTLRMIAGLEVISGGNFLIDDIRMNDIPPKDRDIAMVFQNYALYPHINVYKNLAFSLKVRKMDKKEIDRRIQEAAKILGLEALLDRKPKALSGGQRQRVALGRAIVRDAKVFLMDEPLSNLDAKLRAQMRTEIQKLHQRLKTTTIYVTHDQTEAMTMATRLVVMKDGFIQQVGTPKEVYDTPENVFVGGFIGSPAMNFFNGKIEKGYFKMEKIKLSISKDKLQALEKQNLIGKNIILGIRPEDFQDAVLNNHSYNKISVNVEVAELMGSETYVYASMGGQEFVARVKSRDDIHAGGRLSLGLDLGKAHFFDAITEQRIKLE